MQKTIIIFIALLASPPVFTRANAPYGAGKDTGSIADDTLTVSQDSIAAAEARGGGNDTVTGSYAQADTLARHRSLRFVNNVKDGTRQTYQKGAVKFRYDHFSEKMKEPWIGDILKDILFR